MLSRLHRRFVWQDTDFISIKGPCTESWRSYKTSLQIFSMGSCFGENYYRPYNLLRCVSCTTSYHLNALCILCQTGNYLKASKQAWLFSFHYYCSKKHNYVVRQGNLFSLLVCFCCLKLKRSHRLEKENTRLTLRHTTEASAENIFLEKISGHWTSFMLKASNLIQTLSRLLCSFGGDSYYPLLPQCPLIPEYWRWKGLKTNDILFVGHTEGNLAFVSMGGGTICILY